MRSDGRAFKCSVAEAAGVAQGNNDGIYVSGGLKNTIMRNNALGNGSPVTNYSIASGNNPGPVDAANSSTNSWSNTQ